MKYLKRMFESTQPNKYTLDDLKRKLDKLEDSLKGFREFTWCLQILPPRGNTDRIGKKKEIIIDYDGYYMSSRQKYKSTFNGLIDLLKINNNALMKGKLDKVYPSEKLIYGMREEFKKPYQPCKVENIMVVRVDEFFAHDYSRKDLELMINFFKNVDNFIETIESVGVKFIEEKKTEGSPGLDLLFEIPELEAFQDEVNRLSNIPIHLFKNHQKFLDSLEEFDWLNDDEIIKVKFIDAVEEYGIEGVEIPNQIPGFTFVKEFTKGKKRFG